MIKNTNEQCNIRRMFTGKKLKKRETHTHIGVWSLNTAETGDNVPCLSSLFIAFFIKYHYVWYDWVFVVSHHVMLSNNLDYCIVEFCNESCIANASTVLRITWAIYIKWICAAYTLWCDYRNYLLSIGLKQRQTPSGSMVIQCACHLCFACNTNTYTHIYSQIHLHILIAWLFCALF